MLWSSLGNAALYFCFQRSLHLQKFSTEGIELAAAELWLNDNTEWYCGNSRPLCSFSVCVDDWQGAVHLSNNHRKGAVLGTTKSTNEYLPPALCRHIVPHHCLQQHFRHLILQFSKNNSLVAFWFVDIDVLFDHWSNNDWVKGEVCVQRPQEKWAWQKYKNSGKYGGCWCLN